jgi:hypothetical protein
MSAHSGQSLAQDFNFLKNPAERLRPIKPLPTARVSPQNQLRILRAWAYVSSEGTKAATVNEVASTVDMASSTVAMTNPFFSSIGLLQRLAVGTYVPSKEVVAFLNANNPQTAGRSLSPAFRDAWFGQLIVPKLKYAPMDEQSILSALQDASGVGQEQKKALGFILDFMEAVELVERNGDQIKLARWCAAPPPLIPTVSLDGSTYCVSVRVDSKVLAERLVELFNSLAALSAEK